MNEMKVEIHKCKKIIELINELEGIIKIISINPPIQKQMLLHITDIKDILKEAKLQNNIIFNSNTKL